MLTISSGHSASYLTDAVATGRENYYTGAVSAGEPPGRWYGRGAERLGLSGEVDHQDMAALFERFIDPRDEGFRDPEKWDEAATLGHAGRKYQTADQIYAKSLEAEPHASEERKAELRTEAGKKARKNVAFVDATFSVQKSVTVLHTAFEAKAVRANGAADQARSALVAAERSGDAGAVHRLTEAVRVAEAEAAAWGAHRRAVEDAIWAGNNASLDYLADKAGYSRVGHHGGAAGRWTDAHDWTVASFFQHDNREHEPQLHIHNPILNRVEGADGEWRTLDSRAIHKYRGAAAAVGERVMEEHLSRSLGVRFATRPDGKSREIVGVPKKVMDLFSSRRRAITTKTAKLVQAFEAKHDRAPNALQLDRIQRKATFATRKAKSHEGEDDATRLERVEAETRTEVTGGLSEVADNVLKRRQREPAVQPWSERAVLETALADVQETKAGWTEGDLTRAISNALPDHLGITDPGDVARLLDGLTARALGLAVPLDAVRPGDDLLPDSMRVASGTSAYQAPGGRLYATPAHVHTERLLAASTVERGADAMPTLSTERFLNRLGREGSELGADQAAAVRGVLSSGALVETLVGPAGTGKSYVVGTLARAWSDPALWRDGQQRRVIGLAASQIATQVLEDEGLQARNITRWLAAQQRLAEAETPGAVHAEDEAVRLAAGDLVVVDESAMADTASVAAIHSRCRAAGAKLLLTGDHRQLAAVGAGGAMDLVAQTGMRHELSEVRRFVGASRAWEGPASLRLRDGDQSVLEEYHKHGRIIDGGAIEQTEQAAGRAWLADTLDDKHSLLIVDSNEQAARLSAQLRAALVERGRVDEDGVPLGLQGTYAGRGDVIQARRNAWDLAGVDGNRRGPINREQYRVLSTRDDGGLVVAPITGRADGGEILGDRMTLPGSYVAEHVALGYASTVYGAQGLTVDTAHTVATGYSGADALYVGLTRGRENNTAYVVTQAPPSADSPTGETAEAERATPATVLAAAFERAETQRPAIAEAAESTARNEAVATPGELFADAVEQATAARSTRWLDELTVEGHLSEEQRQQIAKENGATTLTTLLRRAELAGHDPETVLRDAVTSRDLSDAREITNVLHRRINHDVDLTPQGATFTERLPQVDDPQMAAYIGRVARVADDRGELLGEQTVETQPQWAVEAFGEPPAADDPQAASERASWVERAATVATYRELADHDDEAEPIGQAPKSGEVEKYAAWRAAWSALGRPEADRAEAEMSDGQLRMRIRAMERENAWAPAYVANELAGTRQSAERYRHDATLRVAEAAHAANTGDTETADDLRTQASEAEALAGVLDARAAELADVDDARAVWLVETAETKAAALRAEYELDARRAETEIVEDETTAARWLAADDDAVRAEDPHRDIDRLVDPEHDHHVAVDDDTLSDGAATDDPVDVRDVAAGEERLHGAEEPVVPSADETTESVTRAQRALLEIRAREHAEADHAAAEQQAADEARWHGDDQQAREAERARARDDDGPELSRI